MTLRPLLLSVSCVALLASTGCRTLTGSANCHKPQPYESAEDLPPLRVPAGLEGPDTSGALEIPDLETPEAPRAADGPCLEAPPALTAPPPPPSDVVLPDPRRRNEGAAPRSGSEAGSDEPERDSGSQRRRTPRRPR